MNNILIFDCHTHPWSQGLISQGFNQWCDGQMTSDDSPWLKAEALQDDLELGRRDRLLKEKVSLSRHKLANEGQMAPEVPSLHLGSRTLGLNVGTGQAEYHGVSGEGGESFDKGADSETSRELSMAKAQQSRKTLVIML
jgi:hypothetical protein